VHVIGHPTGRLVNGRPGLDLAMNELYAAAHEHHTALEINGHSVRLDLRDTHVRGAMEAGCMIAINCDVHGADDFNELRYGVATAQRGWLAPSQCINCFDAHTLDAWRRRKR
jgi:DNA polymerase (family 10)